jgi:outer membrane protein assembly factor BamB
MINPPSTIINPPSPMAILRLSLSSVLLLLFTACSSVNLNPLEWWSGDDEVNPPAELQAIDAEVRLGSLWSVAVGNGQGDNYTEITPAVDGDNIFAASENGTIIAVDIASGDVNWRRRLDTPVTGGVGAGDGVMMIGTQDAELLVLNQADGELIWRSPVSSEVLSPPETNGDIVVAQTVDGKLVALDRETGEQRWIYETTLPALTLRGTSKPVITPLGSVVAGFSNGTLVSVSAEDGVWRWEERVAVPEGEYDIDRVIDVDGDLLLDGNRILASSYQGNLMAFDVASGRIVWGMEASSYHGLDQGFGNIYYCSDSSHVIAVRDNTNDVVWENTDLEYRSITAPTAFNNYIVVADFEGYLHILSQIDGRIVGRTRIDNDGVRSNLLVAGNRLFAFGNSGRLMALSLE